MDTICTYSTYNGKFIVKYSYIRTFEKLATLGVFIWDPLVWVLVASEEAVHLLRKQEYLDEVSSLGLSPSYSTWYNVDVATLLNRTRIVGHEVDNETGQSLVFFDRSVMLCCPASGKMHHYPKHLLHCFVDDNRCDCSEHDGVLFRAELFSISPKGEQLCWEACCRSEMEVPEVQTKVSRWLSWLNE